MNKIHLESFWHDQTHEPIKISVLRMRVAFMMFYRMNITKSYWLSNKTLHIGGIMKGNPAIAYWKYVVNDFYDWLNRFAFGRGWSLIGAI